MIPYESFLKLLPNVLRNPKNPEARQLYKESIFTAALHPTFSGFGEDAHLLHAIQRYRGLHPGFYVDLGSFHPVNHSNTFLLHLIGWSGLNVDANKNCIEDFDTYRPNDINLHAGVSDIGETKTFYHVGFGLGSSFDRKWVEDIAQKHNRTINSEQEVVCYNINDIFKSHLPKDTTIDVLDIDIEGHDEKVISCLDWERYRPTFVLAEQHARNIQEALESRIYQQMTANEYELISFLPPTLIFLDKRHTKK